MTALGQHEREAYLAFHRTAYQEDLNICRELLRRSPRWSIIIGYYAMHNLAKLYLGVEHGVKVVGTRVHEAVVRELRRVLQHTSENKRLFELLATADTAFRELQQPREVSDLLERGRRKRSEASYYLREDSSAIVETGQAEHFHEKVVLVFAAILGRMCNAA